MQRNPGYPSIEGELEKAICKAGGISAANAESFSKVQNASSLHSCMSCALLQIRMPISIKGSMCSTIIEPSFSTQPHPLCLQHGTIKLHFHYQAVFC